MTPKARAHRILKAMSNYRDFELSGYPHYLRPSSSYIGVYENIPNSDEDAILIKNEGVEILGSNSQSIPFSKITSLALPMAEKTEIDKVLVRIKSVDDELFVPVRGGRGRFRDVFEFLRFLSRCQKDAQSNTR